MEPISLELIQKYLSGHCSAEEEAIVLNWYNSFETKADPFDKLTAWQQQELKLRMFVNIKLGLKEDIETSAVKRNYVKYITYAAGIAATVLLIINSPNLLNRVKPFSPKSNTAQPEIVFANKSQTIQKHILPDNSIVWLSPNAQIKFRKNFKGKIREVSLSGQSFFEVTKDKGHPFVIYSSHITTRVWGTSFLVSDINNSSNAEVDVVTGKVSVSIAAGKMSKGDRNNSPNTQVMLLPKQKVVYENSGNKLVVDKTVRLSSISIWNKANLYFENVPLKEVLLALSKQYNVEITLQDNGLNSYLLNADFNDQSLPDVMEVLKKLLKLSYVIDGKRFILQKDMITKPII